METEDYVNYQQALRLKEMGFNWPTNNWYNYEKRFIGKNSCHAANPVSFQKAPDHADAPTLAQVTKWLREIYRISVEAYYPKDVNGTWSYAIIFMDETTPNIYSHKWESYEKALSAGIDKVLELLKER